MCVYVYVYLRACGHVCVPVSTIEPPSPPIGCAVCVHVYVCACVCVCVCHRDDLGVTLCVVLCGAV
jgi:hypothetical protein